MAGERRVPIASDTDVVTARAEGRRLASELPFTSTDLTLIATAISEMARNIIVYAGEGEIVVGVRREKGRDGLWVRAADEGPGIADVSRALTDSNSTGMGLGLGLPGTRRIMDEFAISSAPGQGTVVEMTMWAGPRRG